MIIHIDTVPRPSPRPRFGRKTYNPSWYVDYITEIKLKMKAQRIIKLQGKLSIAIEVQDVRGDVDNIAKGILDAGNGILWVDDSQIMALSITKSSSPGITLLIMKF